MATRRYYEGKLANPISLKEAEERGPVALHERYELLAEHYGIDPKTLFEGDGLKRLAIALVAKHVPGCRIRARATSNKPGGRPAVRKPWEDAAILYAVEWYQDEHMQERGRRNYTQACKQIIMLAREGNLTPELKIIPETYLVDDTKGSARGKLRAACSRAKARRERAGEIPDATPIGKLFYAMLTKL